MKRSYVIALAGISAALSYVSIILSFYVDIMSISFGALAGICLMLPLSVGSFTGALFAYISASVLSGLTVGFGAMSFILFFGPFTLVGYLVDFKLYDKMKSAKWVKMLVGYIIKGITYAGTLTALYFIMSAFGNVDVIIETNLKWVAIVLLIVLFFLFDLLLRLVFINLRYIVTRRILKVQNIEEPKPKKEKPKCDNDVFGIDENDTSEDVQDDASEDTGDAKQDGVDESTSRFEHFLEQEEKDKKDNENKED